MRPFQARLQPFLDGHPFDKWMTRPVYVVQCKTFAKARELLKLPMSKGGYATSGYHLINELRVLPGHRSKEGQLLRDMVATAMRIDRLNSRLDR